MTDLLAGLIMVVCCAGVFAYLRRDATSVTAQVGRAVTRPVMMRALVLALTTCALMGLLALLVPWTRHGHGMFAPADAGPVTRVGGQLFLLTAFSPLLVRLAIEHDIDRGARLARHAPPVWWHTVQAPLAALVIWAVLVFIAGVPPLHFVAAAWLVTLLHLSQRGVPERSAADTVDDGAGHHGVGEGATRGRIGTIAGALAGLPGDLRTAVLQRAATLLAALVLTVAFLAVPVVGPFG